MEHLESAERVESLAVPTPPIAAVPAAAEDLLTIQARRVYAARVMVGGLEQELERAEQEFAEENADLIARLNAARAAVDAEEDAARELTVTRFVETGEKKPAPGLGIRLVKAVEYDPAQALTWAKSTGLAIQLDRRAFEKMAVAAVTPGTPSQRENGTRVYQTTIPGALVVELPQATIAEDLGAVLPPTPAPSARGAA